MNYFKRSEMSCKCGCGFDTMDYDLMCILNHVREVFGKPIVINSGCRCPSYNKEVGGAKSSLHLQGKAADIRFSSSEKELTTQDIYDHLNKLYPDSLGLAVEGRFCHVDVRSGKAARWSY